MSHPSLHVRLGYQDQGLGQTFASSELRFSKSTPGKAYLSFRVIESSSNPNKYLRDSDGAPLFFRKDGLNMHQRFYGCSEALKQISKLQSIRQVEIKLVSPFNWTDEERIFPLVEVIQHFVKNFFPTTTLRDSSFKLQLRPHEESQSLREQVCRDIQFTKTLHHISGNELLPLNVSLPSNTYG